MPLSIFYICSGIITPWRGICLRLKSDIWFREDKTSLSGTAQFIWCPWLWINSDPQTYNQRYPFKRRVQSPSVLAKTISLTWVCSESWGQRHHCLVVSPTYIHLPVSSRVIQTPGKGHTFKESCRLSAPRIPTLFQLWRKQGLHLPQFSSSDMRASCLAVQLIAAMWAEEGPQPPNSCHWNLRMCTWFGNWVSAVVIS